MHHAQLHHGPTSAGAVVMLEVLGNRLRAARLHAGLSQETVAHQAGCSARSVTRWETGKCDPGIVMLSQLAEICRVSLPWLLSAGNAAQRFVEH